MAQTWLKLAYINVQKVVHIKLYFLNEHKYVDIKMKTEKTIGFWLFGITTFVICQYSGLEILSILLPPQGNQRFILRQSSLDCIQAFISYLG